MMRFASGWRARISPISIFLILTDSVVDVRSPHREGKISVLVSRSTTEQASSNNAQHKMCEITTNGIKPQKASELANRYSHVW